MGSTEAREIDLVGKVELKIALTQSDTALQSILKTYLPPLLLKLKSEHVSVRNKVSKCTTSDFGKYELLQLHNACCLPLRIESLNGNRMGRQCAGTFLTILMS